MLGRELGQAQLGEARRGTDRQGTNWTGFCFAPPALFALFHSASRTVTVSSVLLPMGQSCIPGSRICFDGLPDVLKQVDFIPVKF